MRRRPLLALLAALPLAAPVAAHEGHDHGATPAAVAAALPRAEAQTDLFEVVAVLQPGGVLAITLDRFTDNAPVDGAVTLTVDDAEVAAERTGVGLFVARHPRLAEPGERNLVFSVTAGEEMDLLTATLVVPAAPAGEAGAGSIGAALRALPLQVGIGALLLLAGLALGRASVRRPLPPMVEKDEPAPPPAARPAAPPVAVPSRAREVASVALATLLLAGAAEAQTGGGAAEAPRRLDDGAIFVPKSSQRLLTIRTQLTATGEAAASLQMVGTLVPDPGASGRVQPSQTGRLEAGERGLPTLGQRVERGQVLAYVTPSYSAAERGQLTAGAAELDAQITILTARVNRLRALRGSVSEREISEAEAELAGARQRRSAIQPALSGREALTAPVSGVVSVVRAAVGQIVDSQAAVFEVVDPSRLWVEALAFDRAAVDRITGASATLADGRVVELDFVGRGLAVRQQAVPVNFRVRQPPEDAAIGGPVVVTVRTARAVQGVVLPADAVVRSPEGPPVVYEHATAERFVPRQVRVQPLDGARVVVTAGLEPDRRVVVQGAGLIAQVR
ncbi:efflux RND transporter periplasmic adaptor subunit [Muricoccus radiodurans]|uniref:efflux RND transporter periplasmic adaptor subunit n=1 Tax=Muricoccus radiodurans TaxID=2231721 RepID=UPI003CF5E499